MKTHFDELRVARCLRVWKWDKVSAMEDTHKAVLRPKNPGEFAVLQSVLKFFGVPLSSA